MKKRKTLPLKEGLLPRPRMNELFQQGLKKPLITVVAGPGYAKTQATAAFVAGLDARVVWMRLNPLDNIISRFWDSFVSVVRAEDKVLANKLELMGFPDTLTKFDTFIRVLAKEVYAGKQVVFVLDEYNFISDNRIHHFIEDLVEINLENFTLILISRAKVDLNILSMIDNDLLFQVGPAELRFDMDETKALLARHNVAYTQKALEALDAYVEGWPLALYLLVKAVENQRLEEVHVQTPNPQTLQLFEKQYFADYPTALQDLFIKLSLLPNFHIDIARQVGGHSIEEMVEVLDRNMFVHFYPQTGLYIFQNLFRTFLSKLQVRIPQEEKERVYSVAGDWYLANGRQLEAITFYEKCGRYDDMFNAIANYPFGRLEEGLATFMAEYLDKLPETYQKEHPITRFVLASFLFNNFEIDRAYELFMILRQEHEAMEQTPEIKAFLGEVYLMLGDISILHQNDSFAWYYNQAERCLPMGSRRRDKNLMLLDNNDIFFLQGTGPGELERMRNVFMQALPKGSEVMNGSGQGLEHMYAAEAAYLTGDFATAREEAYKASYRAKGKNQHDIVCNASFLLMKIAVMAGSQEEALAHMDEIDTYIEQAGATNMLNLRDCAQAWLYEKLDQLEKVPKWILDEGQRKQKQFPLSRGRARLLHANCLLRQKRYFELLAQLAQLEIYYKKRGLWTALLHTYIMRAICQLKIGNRDKALVPLFQAYKMTYQNHITVPFIEYGNHMRTMMELARRSEEYEFDTEWVDTIQQKASTFAKRLSTMTVDQQAAGAKSAPAIHLTEREQEVLQCLAQGLIREEIGDSLHISVNTVKSIIKNIYGKLGAVNRADAVYIATVMGLLS